MRIIEILILGTLILALAAHFWPVRRNGRLGPTFSPE